MNKCHIEMIVQVHVRDFTGKNYGSCLLFFLTEIGVSQTDHFAPIGSQYTGELAEFPKTLL